MIGQKLYMAVWVHDETTDYEECYHDDASCECFDPMPEPAGWAEYAREAWPVKPEHEVWPNGYKPFFWPKTDVPYKSRSSAQYRVDIINRWGGRAVVVECTPHWETVSAANQRRARERLQKSVDRKRAELAELEARLN